MEEVMYMNIIDNAFKNARKSDLIMLFYWFPYLIVFKLLEDSKGPFHVMETTLDHLIPFVSIFVYPYLFWFIYMAICIVYLFICNKEVYRHLMVYIIIGYSLGLFVFAVFPSAQYLRVDVSMATSLSDHIINFIYGLDTSTNVCPSIHVIGALGAMMIMLKTDLLKSNVVLRAINIIVGISICLSTVFIKQHSVIDVGFGILIAFVLYDVSYRLSLRLR